MEVYVLISRYIFLHLPLLQKQAACRNEISLSSYRPNIEKVEINLLAN